MLLFRFICFIFESLNCAADSYWPLLFIVIWHYDILITCPCKKWPVTWQNMVEYKQTLHSQIYYNEMSKCCGRNPWVRCVLMVNFWRSVQTLISSLTTVTLKVILYFVSCTINEQKIKLVSAKLSLNIKQIKIFTAQIQRGLVYILCVCTRFYYYELDNNVFS